MKKEAKAKNDSLILASQIQSEDITLDCYGNVSPFSLMVFYR